MGTSRQTRRKTTRRPPPTSHAGETENWFLTAPETVVGVVSGARGGVRPILAGRFPNTSMFRWIGFVVVVIVGHLKLRRHFKSN